MVGRVLGSIVRVLDWVRKFLHLVLLLLIFGVMLGALKGSIPHMPRAA